MWFSSSLGLYAKIYSQYCFNTRTKKTDLNRCMLVSASFDSFQVLFCKLNHFATLRDVITEDLSAKHILYVDRLRTSHVIY